MPYSPELNEKRRWYNRPHTLFLLIALVFGSIFIVLTPPLRAPDEDHHFARILSLSEGTLRGIPHAPAVFRDYIIQARTKAQEIHHRTPQHPVYYLPASIITSLVAPTAINNTEIVSLDTMNRGILNTPASYLSALPTVWLATHLGAAPAVTFYLARLSLFLVSTLLIYYAIRITPVLKWPLFFLTLFPTLVFIRSSISPDPLNIGYSLLFFALLNQSMLSDAPITDRRIIYLSILSFLLCFSKNIYFLLSGIFFLLPVRKFKSRKQYIAALFCIVILPLIADIGWLSVISQTLHALPHGTDDSFQMPNGVDEHAQMFFVVSHPIVFLQTVWHTWSSQGNWFLFIVHLVGALGLLDMHLPFMLIIPAFLLLFLLPIRKPNEAPYLIPPLHRFLYLGLFIASLLLVALAVYVVWTPVSADSIQGIQGRYFAPIFPLLLMATGWQNFARKYYTYIITFAVFFTLFMLLSSINIFLYHDYGLSLWMF